jgi:HAD superfamily hydrolase (TIGR01509 family)
LAKAVIFDIDGTLLNSVDLHAESWVRAFSHFGITANFQEVRRRIGEGADRLLPVFVPSSASKTRRKEIEEYRSRLFRKEYLPRVQPFPMVRDLFERIREDGRKVVLGSSCTEEEIADYKKIAGVSDIVDCECTSDDAKSSKPAPDIFLQAVKRVAPLRAQDCIVIGDTRYDGEAARSAGISFIGLLCGGSSERQLQEAGAVAIYRDPGHLLSRYSTSPICHEVPPAHGPRDSSVMSAAID